MDEAPPRKKPTFPLHFRFVSTSRFGPKKFELLTDEERDAKLAAEKLAAANAAAASATALPEQPTPAPPLPHSHSSTPDSSRHPRRCSVCSHPDRDAIEGDFIRWRNPQEIAKAYNITDRVSVYRHAHFAGLFQRRKRQVARVLESFLESADSCPIEAADMIIRATRLYVRLNEHGEWTEAPRTQYLITGSLNSTDPPDPAPPAKRRSAATKSDPATPKPRRRARTRKPLTATDPNSENS